MIGRKALVGGWCCKAAIAGHQFVEVGCAATPVSQNEDRILWDWRFKSSSRINCLTCEPHGRVKESRSGNRCSQAPAEWMNTESMRAQELDPIAEEHAVPESGSPGGVLWSLRAV